MQIHSSDFVFSLVQKGNSPNILSATPRKALLHFLRWTCNIISGHFWNQPSVLCQTSRAGSLGRARKLRQTSRIFHGVLILASVPATAGNCRGHDDENVPHGDLSSVTTMYVHIATNHLQLHTGRHCSMMQNVSWQDTFFVVSLCFHERHSNENNRFWEVSGCQATQKNGCCRSASMKGAARKTTVFSRFQAAKQPKNGSRRLFQTSRAGDL